MLLDGFSNIIIHTTNLEDQTAEHGRHRAILEQHLRKTAWFSAQSWSFLEKWQHGHPAPQTIIKIGKYAHRVPS